MCRLPPVRLRYHTHFRSLTRSSPLTPGAPSRASSYYPHPRPPRVRPPQPFFGRSDHDSRTDRGSSGLLEDSHLPSTPTWPCDHSGKDLPVLSRCLWSVVQYPFSGTPPVPPAPSLFPDEAKKGSCNFLPSPEYLFSSGGTGLVLRLSPYANGLQERGDREGEERRT